MPMKIDEALSKLLAIVNELQASYPPKAFTLDGRLLGDIGEVLASEVYDVELFRTIQPHHDGITSNKRKVQIKATMKDMLSFPADHVPDYYLGIKIDPNGAIETIYNGPGSIIAKKVCKPIVPKHNFYNVSLKTLRELDKTVADQDRIPKRANHGN